MAKAPASKSTSSKMWANEGALGGASQADNDIQTDFNSIKNSPSGKGNPMRSGPNKDYNQNFDRGYRARTLGEANANLLSGTDEGLAKGLHILNTKDTVPHSSPDPRIPNSRVGSPAPEPYPGAPEFH